MVTKTSNTLLLFIETVSKILHKICERTTFCDVRFFIPQRFGCSFRSCPPAALKAEAQKHFKIKADNDFFYHSDFCSLRSNRGPCRGIFVRWYYDTDDGFCSPFIYGGCGGNANNFESMEKCEGICSGW